MGRCVNMHTYTCMYIYIYVCVYNIKYPYIHTYGGGSKNICKCINECIYNIICVLKFLVGKKGDSGCALYIYIYIYITFSLLNMFD